MYIKALSQSKKVVYDKSTANIIPNGRETENFPCETKNKIRTLSISKGHGASPPQAAT